MRKSETVHVLLEWRQMVLVRGSGLRQVVKGYGREDVMETVNFWCLSAVSSGSVSTPSV